MSAEGRGTLPAVHVDKSKAKNQSWGNDREESVQRWTDKTVDWLYRWWGGNKNLDEFPGWNMDKGVKRYHFENSEFKEVGEQMSFS